MLFDYNYLIDIHIPVDTLEDDYPSPFRWDMLVFWRLLFVWSSFPSPGQDLVQLRSCCRRLQAELTASRCLSEPEPGAVFFFYKTVSFFFGEVLNGLIRCEFHFFEYVVSWKSK